MLHLILSIDLLLKLIFLLMIIKLFNYFYHHIKYQITNFILLINFKFLKHYNYLKLIFKNNHFNLVKNYILS